MRIFKCDVNGAVAEFTSVENTPTIMPTGSIKITGLSRFIRFLTVDKNGEINLWTARPFSSQHLEVWEYKWGDLDSDCLTTAPIVRFRAPVKNWRECIWRIDNQITLTLENYKVTKVL